MTTTVYIWRNRVKTAHASLQASSSRNDGYLSFHPSNPSGKEGLWGLVEIVATSLVDHFVPQRSSLKEDSNKYGGYPASVVELSYLDEYSMTLFVHELFNNKTRHGYNLFFENCSTTVGMCLIKGFSKLSHDCKFHQQLRYNFEAHGLGRVFSHYGNRANSVLAKLMFEDLPHQFMLSAGRSPEMSRIAITMEVALKGLHSVVWDPDDVLRLAEYIRDFENQYISN